MNAAALDQRAKEILAAPSEARPPAPVGWLGLDASQLPGIGRYLECTLLRPEATSSQVAALCEGARRIEAAAVCVNGRWATTVARRLSGSPLRIVVVAGFPLGAGASIAKAAEARLALLDGATEIDMVMAIGAAREGEWNAVLDDIATVVHAVRGAIVKVILETAALEPLEIVKACLVSRDAGARYVKTSTGFHPGGGATVEAVSLMRRAVGNEFGVKASGGIRTAEQAVRLLAAGANRIGTSSATAWAEAVGPRAPGAAEAIAALRAAPPG